jgi:hypothetical protein
VSGPRAWRQGSAHRQQPGRLPGPGGDDPANPVRRDRPSCVHRPGAVRPLS